jgi:hypothetical protein
MVKKERAIRSNEETSDFLIRFLSRRAIAIVLVLGLHLPALSWPTKRIAY